MLPLIYRPGATQPQRLSNPTQARGYRAGFSPLGGAVFGGIFVAIGIYIVLVGLRIIVPGGRVHVPHWVLIPIGAVFAAGGLFVWGKIWRQRQAENRREQQVLRHPEEPAFADLDWDPSGARSNLKQHGVRATLIVIFFILFLTPFNYLIVKENAPWFAKGVIALFDLITVFLIWDMSMRWGRVFKFGHAVLRFAHFPLRTNEPVRLTWIAPSGCAGSATGSFTLRSVVEWHETTGSGKSRNTRLVHEQQWSGAWVLESPVLITPGMDCELVFNLPPGVRSTTLHVERPQFWELEVALSLSGLDFKDTYLVPIYSPRRTD
jgi:hypothetical protein